MLRKKWLVSTLEALFTVLLIAPSANAVTINWGGTTGDWSSTSNWDLNRLPTTSDNASIANGGTVKITLNGAICNDLTLGAAGGSGTIQMTAGTLSTTNQYVGNLGSGTFTQSGGTNSFTTCLYLGYGAGTLGTYKLTGSSKLSCTQSGNGLHGVCIGYSGTGLFTQSGGNNNESDLYLGYNAESNGTYTLSSGSLSVGDNQYVGYSGTGTFTQTGGTNSHSTMRLYLGYNAGARGDYHLSGTGILSAWFETVGAAGVGNFTQSGGTNSTSSLTIHAGSNYTLNSGSLSASDESQGGTFMHTGGSHSVTNMSMTGTYTLSGTGSLLTYGESIGPGTFTQSGGTHTIAGYSDAALIINGGGAYNLNGSGTLNAGNEIVVQGSFVQNGGSNTTKGLSVASGSRYELRGGMLQINAGTDIQGVIDGGGTTGTLIANCIIDLTKGTWQNVGHMSVSMGSNSLLIVPPGVDPSHFFGTFGSQGIIHTLGTTLVVPPNSRFTWTGVINDPVNCQGTINSTTIIDASGTYNTNLSLSNGLVLSALGNADLGDYGNLTVNDASSTMMGGALHLGTAYIGKSGAGVFTQSAGTSTLKWRLYCGYNAGDNGTYNLNGTASLSVTDNEYIGYSGTGTFLHSAGTHSITQSLYIGTNSGSNGTYNLSGSGILTASGEFLGNATFIQTGGTNTITGPNFYVRSAATYQLSGGLLSCKYDERINSNGTFIQSGGTHNVMGTGSNGLVMSGSYSLSGDGLLSSPCEIVSGVFLQTGGVNSITLRTASPNGLRIAGGSYSLSGSGQLSAASENIGYSSTTGMFAQFGGTNTTTNVSITSGSVYQFSGGLFQIAESFVNQGSFDGGNGSGSLSANCLVDLTTGAWKNLGATHVSMGSNSLLIVAGGFDPSTDLGSFVTTGMAPHVLGTALTVPAGMGFGGTGSINDPVTCEGTIAANSGGAINLNNGLMLTSTGSVVLGSGGYLTVNDNTSGLSGGSLSAGNQYIGKGGAGLFSHSGGTSSVTNVYLGYNNTDSGIYNLSGSGTLLASTEYVGQSGSGTFTQTGGTNTTASLQLSSSSQSSGTYNLNGGTLVVGNVTKGSGTVVFNIDGGILKASSSFASSVPISLNTGGAVVDTAGKTPTLSGVLSGSGALQKTGTGTLILSGINVFTGATTVSNGIVKADSGVGLSSTSLLSLDGGILQCIGAVTFTRSLGASGGKVQWTPSGGGFSAGSNAMTVNIGGGDALTWGTIVGANIVGTLRLSSPTATKTTTFLNAIDLNGADRTILVDDNTASTGDYAVISGIISNSIGTAGLIKTGTGKLVLSAANTYNGNTEVGGGILALSAAEAISSSPLIDVQNGATLDASAVSGGFKLAAGQALKGSGTVLGDLTILGIQAPGSSPGVATVKGNYSMLGQLNIELAGTTAGTGYDEVLLPLSGTTKYNATLGGTLNLDWTVMSGSTDTTQLWILKNDTAGALSGMFGNYGNGAALGTHDGRDWFLWYGADAASGSLIGGNDVVIAAVPEPSALVLLGIITAAFLLWARRRRGWLSRRKIFAAAIDAKLMLSVLVIVLGSASFLACMTSTAVAAIVGTGDIVPSNPANWTSSTDCHIGDYSTGAVTVNGGSKLFSKSAYLGRFSNSSGTVTVAGNGSTWTCAQDLYIGDLGSGVLSVADGGTVTIGETLFTSMSNLLGNGTITARGAVLDADLFFDATHARTLVFGSAGTLNLDVTGNADLGAGYEGVGTLSIADGVTVNSFRGYLGYLAGSNGAASVSGAGSKWISSNRLDVGYHGNGSLHIQSGGQVSSTAAFVGGYSTSSGTVTVTGTGSSWINGNDLYIGSVGQGTLIIEAGGRVQTGSARIAQSSGSSGTATITGAGSSWSCQGLDVGYSGDGTMTIEAGGVVSDRDGNIGIRSGLGIVNVRGIGSQWLNSNSVLVGWGAFGEPVIGILNIEAGGLVQTIGSTVGLTAVARGTATVNGLDSKWINSGNLTIGRLGTGTLNIEAGGEVQDSSGYLGNNAGSSGTATVTGTGSKWTNKTNLFISYSGSGTLNIAAGGKVSNKDGYLGYSSGAPIGNVTVSGTDSTWINSGYLYVGFNGNGTLAVERGGQVSDATACVGAGYGASGTIIINGVGSKWIHSAELQVGSTGNGTLIIEDGGQVNNPVGYLGQISNSFGAATVTGNNSRWSNTDTLFIGYAGSGTLTIGSDSAGGGVVAANTLILANHDGSQGTCNLNGGVLTAATIAKGDGTADFNWNDGTIQNPDLFTDLNVSGRLVLNLAATGMHVFNVDSGRKGTVDAILSDANSGGTLAKVGEGLLKLTAANTYTGSTTITAGTLALSSTGSLASSLIEVGGGAMFDISEKSGGFLLEAGKTLQGSGTIVGNLFISGMHAPGNSASRSMVSDNLAPCNLASGNMTGVETVKGNYSMLGELRIDLLGSIAGTGYDQVLLPVNGSAKYNVTLGGMLALDWTDITGCSDTTQLWILKNDTAGALSGMFGNYANGASLGNHDGRDWFLWYGADAATGNLTGGNDVVIATVPEPSTLLLLSCCLAVLVGFAWRHKGERKPH